MEESIKRIEEKNHPEKLGTRIGQGAAIGAILIVIVFILIEEPRPDDLVRMVLPLTLVPAAGALGGAVYFWLDPLRSRSGWKRSAANFLSVLIYLLLIFTALVLTMSGTD